MGFWEDNPDVGGGGGAWLVEADKMQLVESGAVFDIVGVQRRENPFEADVEQHVVAIATDFFSDDDETEEKLMSFTIGNVESRNKTLDRMAKYFEQDDTAIEAQLTKVGRSYLVLPAGEEAPPAPKPKRAAPKPKATAAKKSTAKTATAAKRTSARGRAAAKK